MVLTLPTALTGYSHEWAMQPELVAPQLPGTARRHWVASSTWKYNAALTELANTTPAATSTRLEHGATAVSNWLLSKGYRPAVTPVPPAVAVPVGSKPAGTTGFAVFSHKFTSTERTWLEFPYTSQLPSFTTGKLTGTSLMVMDFDAMELYVIVTASAGRYKFYWIVASDEDDLETAIAGTDVENPTWLPSTTPGRTFYFSNEVSDSVPYTNSRSFNYSLNSAEYLPIPLFRGTQSLTAPLLMVEQNHNWLTGAIENPKIDDNYGVGFQQETVANTMTFSTSLTELVRGTNTHLARNGYYKIYAPGTKGHALAVVINYLDKKGYYDLTIFL